MKAARRIRGRKRPFAVAIAVTIMAVILLFSLVQPSNQHISVSTEKAPETVETAYMERFAAAMVTDDEKRLWHIYLRVTGCCSEQLKARKAPLSFS